MNKSNPLSRARRSTATQRARFLEAFDRSGLSAADFARKHHLNYTTFCGWRQRRADTTALPAFVQVEVTPPSAPVELLIELGSSARLRIQVARLIETLNAKTAC